MMRNRKWLSILCAVFLCVPAFGAQVRVWEGTLSLPTYEEGPPDTNPPFDQFASAQFNYPYTLRNNLTGKRANHAWRAIFIENQYLKCSILPDLGGHIYTCVDKISGRPMFYANPSIKKANIGYRGAWAAFGVEFNFPISHNWTSLSPVPYFYGQNPDGSAWVRIGNIDRVYGMEWTVELVLRPGTAFLEEHVTLDNRSNVRHRFYWWDNAGVEVTDESRIEYPMQFSAAHGFADVDTWPVDSTGKDLSLIRNQTDGPVSRFDYGSQEPFMALWRPDTQTGTVHYADYAALPAKKIWSWGADADAHDWREALSDNNSAYVEMQAGLFRNQETYGFLQPQKTIRFVEYWMPVRGIGGVSRANLAGIVNMSRSGSTLKVGLNVNRVYKGASIRITDGKDPVLDQRVDLAPETTWLKTVPHASSRARYTIEVRAADGTQLLRHTENEYRWTPADEIRTGPRKNWTPPPPASRSEDDWVQAGHNQEQVGQLLTAMDTYSTALTKYPDSFTLHKAAGRLAVSLLQYDRAVHELEPVQARDTSDAEIAYYLGIAYEGNGELRQARASYEAAARMPEFHVAGSLQLAEMLAREGKRDRALEILAGLHGGDLRVIEETVAIENSLGHTADAQKLARQTLGSASSLFLQFEMSSLSGPGSNVLQFLAADPNRVLNIATEYMRLGLFAKALKVLSLRYPHVPAGESEPGAALPQDDPVVAYFRGYCREKMGESPAMDYSAASRMSTLYVFPSGAETLSVLQEAARFNPNDATAQFLLGTHFFSRGLTAPALAAWERARTLNPRMPALDADIARVLLNVRHDPARAFTAFRDGTSSDSSNPALYFGMDQALSLLARPASERVKALERYPDLASMPVDMLYELALSRAEAGDFDGARALFKGRFFPRREGGTNVRAVWVEVMVQEALSRAAAGRCQDALAVVANLTSAVPNLEFTRSGLEAFIQPPRIHYLAGKVEAACGLRDQANKDFTVAAQSRSLSGLIWARRAARKLPGYDDVAWEKRLEAAVAPAEKQISAGELGSRADYVAGSIYDELGDSELARARYTDAILLPDSQLTWHLARLALADMTPR